MAKGSNQKLKIVYLIKILTEKTDEQHSITMNEIISELKAYGVNAERKSLYNDIENLRQYGLDIVGEQHDRTYYYYLVSRQFASIWIGYCRRTARQNILLLFGKQTVCVNMDWIL